MFGSMPIEVLTRDFDLEDDPAERAARPIWIQLQKELAALSLAGNWRVVKGASHAIHIDKGKDVKTIQGLLRHAKASTTLDLCSQAIDASKLNWRRREISHWLLQVARRKRINYRCRL
jgi:hypothetical protein